MKEHDIDNALKTLANYLKEDASVDGVDTPIHFKGKIYNKGFFWSGIGHTKQLVLVNEPDRLFSSESIDLAPGKEISIGKVPMLSEQELGKSIIKSNLREVGRLKGLVVDGSLSVNQFLYFDAHSDRLGLGTDEPNGALSVYDDGVEVVIGTEDFKIGQIGTFAHNDFQIKTDDTARITVGAGGDITLGNANKNPIKVSVHGKLAVGVSNPDQNVDLHVNGAIKFENHTHIYDNAPPTGGVWNEGDIVWNNSPKQRQHVGWVCTKAGKPGIWNPFGEIK
jgi:hypothetical protein